eukprot:5005081-Prymnesium_polylepis.1
MAVRRWARCLAAPASASGARAWLQQRKAKLRGGVKKLGVHRPNNSQRPQTRPGPTPALWNETLGHGGHDF